MAYADGMDEAPVIGTVEHRPPIGADRLSSRRAVTSDSTNLAAEVSQRS
jgi:hypothetical protein